MNPQFDPKTMSFWHFNRPTVVKRLTGRPKKSEKWHFLNDLAHCSLKIQKNTIETSSGGFGKKATTVVCQLDHWFPVQSKFHFSS